MNNAFKRLAARLLATTCLTAAASAVALGSAVVEPAGGFGSTFATRTILSPGVTQVSGSVTANNGNNDWFELTGLTGGASLTSLSFLFQNNSAALPIGVFLGDDTNTVTVSALQSVASLTSYSPVGTVPLDGNLVVDLVPSNEGGAPYVLTLNPSSSAPEPGTFAALGLGLAGLGSVALRRRFRKS